MFVKQGNPKWDLRNVNTGHEVFHGQKEDKIAFEQVKLKIKWCETLKQNNQKILAT